MLGSCCGVPNLQRPPGEPRPLGGLLPRWPQAPALHKDRRPENESVTGHTPFVQDECPGAGGKKPPRVARIPLWARWGQGFEAAAWEEPHSLPPAALGLAAWPRMTGSLVQKDSRGPSPSTLRGTEARGGPDRGCPHFHRVGSRVGGGCPTGPRAQWAPDRPLWLGPGALSDLGGRATTPKMKSLPGLQATRWEGPDSRALCPMHLLPTLHPRPWALHLEHGSRLK